MSASDAQEATRHHLAPAPQGEAETTLTYRYPLALIKRRTNRGINPHHLIPGPNTSDVRHFKAGACIAVHRAGAAFDVEALG
jgi:hypothetical protein